MRGTNRILPIKKAGKLFYNTKPQLPPPVGWRLDLIESEVNDQLSSMVRLMILDEVKK